MNENIDLLSAASGGPDDDAQELQVGGTPLELPTELLDAAPQRTTVDKKTRERRIQRAASRWVYQRMRGKGARKWARRLSWDHTSDRPGLTSTVQISALSPLLAPTRPLIVGPQLGQDNFTNQPLTHSLQGLYALGIIKSTNAVILGGIGSAKSTLVKTHYIMRGILLDDQRCVVFDRKRQTRDGGVTEGEYVRVASLVDSRVITLNRGGGTRINILDPIISTSTSKEDTEGTVGQDSLLSMVAEAAMERPLTPEERYVLHTAHKRAISRGKAENRVAILSDVIHHLYAPDMDSIPGPMGEEEKLLFERGVVDVNRVTEWGLPLALGLERFLDGDLSGLLDGETSVGGEMGHDWLNTSLLVIDTSALPEDSLSLSLMMMVFSTYLMAAWVTMPGYKTLVLEEAYSNAGLNSVPMIFRELVKRSRGVGATVVSVFHHMSDVPTDSPLRSVIRESGVQHIFVQDRPDDVDDVVTHFGLPSELAETIQLLPTGTHVLCRGKLPATIVTGYRTQLERWAAFTDNAMRATV